MKNLIRACIAMAGFAALSVLPSVASASPELTCPAGLRCPVGTNLMATNVAHSNTVLTTKLVTGLGNVECETATLTGELTSNTGSHIAGEITTAEFKGTPGNSTSAHCAGGFGGNTTVTPSHTTNPEHNGVTALPFCLTANTLNDKLTVFGKPAKGGCTNIAEARPLTFLLHTSTVGTCGYERASLTATYTTAPADAVATVDIGQTFIKNTGGSFCPSSGELRMAFTLTLDNNQVSGNPVYIS